MSVLTCNVCAWRGPVPPRFSGLRVACPQCSAEKCVPRDEPQHCDFGWRLVPASREGRFADRAARN